MFFLVPSFFSGVDRRFLIVLMIFLQDRFYSDERVMDEKLKQIYLTHIKARWGFRRRAFISY